MHRPVRVHLLQAKLVPAVIAEIYSAIEDCHHLELSSNVVDADVIITNVRMRRRLERHLDWNIAQQKAIVDPQWLRDSIQQHRILPCGPYAALSELRDETVKNCPDCNMEVCKCTPSASHLAPHPLLPQQVALDYKARYACQRATPLICPNQALAAELGILRLHRHLEGKEINALAYERAIAVTKSYPHIITFGNFENDFAKLPYLGEKVLSKVKEFLNYGLIEECQTIRSDERFQALSLFNTIHGVGPTTARHLYSMGLRTLEDMDRYYDVPVDLSGRLKVEDVVLTPNGRRVPPKTGIPDISIKTALALRADFEQTIPAEEVEEMHAVVMFELEKIQKGCFSTLVGGYRRGKQKSNDVDVVISHPLRDIAKGLCKKLVNRLYDLGLVTHLTYLSGFHQHNPLRTTHWDSLEKALTVFKLPPDDKRTPVHHRLDLIFAVPEAYWTAVLGWTGSKMFERDLRLWAKVEKGMKFDSSGLTRRHDSKLFMPKSEKEIFDLLGLQWIDPLLRNADV